jgi:carbamoyl-phosphate synthase large subunit
MNILFTSAGRRKYLIEYFLEEVGPCGTVHVANSDPLCASFTINAPTLITPPIYSDEYVPMLLEYCEAQRINALISLFDADLPVLAAAKFRFLNIGTKVLVADTESVAICNDKWKTVQFLLVNGLNAPKTFIDSSEAIKAVGSGVVRFPMIVKPRWGMGSIGLHVVRNMGDLKEGCRSVYEKISDTYLKYESSADLGASVLIQEKLDGQEYGLDIINDLDGNYVMTSVKRKLAMHSGETDIAITEEHPILQKLGETLSAFIKHPANLDVDVFWDGTNATVLEMNARFGGGYPFSHLAGVNLPRAILHWLNSEPAPAECFRWNAGVRGVKTLVPVLF